MNFVYGWMQQAYNRSGKNYLPESGETQAKPEVSNKYWQGLCANQSPYCWALRRWTQHRIQRKAELWGTNKFNSDNSDFWANLKGSLQIEFRLCYLNVYLKDAWEIWALLWIWFSALQKQAKLEFSKIQLSFTNCEFFWISRVNFQNWTVKHNSTENNV